MKEMETKAAGALHLKVPWGHIAAKTWGNVNNSPILMVHGRLDNAGAFDRLIAQLPHNFYYVCIDLPGHGLSSHFEPGVVLNYFNYVLTIRYVLDELQWKHAYYIGHSFGGNLGLLFTIIYPGRIKKLILIDTVVPAPISNNEIISIIRKEHDVAIEGYKLHKSNNYTRDEVIYALKNLRKCSLSSKAAEALFERSVTKIDNDLYSYNRDYRVKLCDPYLSIAQTLHLVTQVKVETLIIFSSDTLQSIKEIKENTEILSTLNNFNFVTVINVKGNHDVHNNYPDRISGYISKFLNHIPSKI